MPQQFLDAADVVVVFEQVRREAMPKRVRADVFMNARLVRRDLDRFLDHGFVQVMAVPHTRVAVDVMARGRKHKLPSPFAIGIGVLML